MKKTASITRHNFIDRIFFVTDRNLFVVDRNFVDVDPFFFGAVHYDDFRRSQIVHINRNQDHDLKKFTIDDRVSVPLVWVSNLRD